MERPECRQVIPYIKGIANTGKSTIINEIAGRFYEQIDVGSVSNNVERQFGISSFADKCLFVAGEIKADFKIDQAGNSACSILKSCIACCLINVDLTGKREKLGGTDHTTMTSLEDLQYMAGQVDGDGSIAILLPSTGRRHLGQVYIRITKTTKNPHMLDWFKETFGGKIHNLRLLSQQRLNNSDTQTWQIECGPAIELCKLLGPHSHIKKREFDMASRFPSDAVRRTALTEVKITKDNDSHVFESMTAAGKYLSRDSTAVRYALKSGGLCAGWRVESHQTFTRDQVKQLIEQMHWSLRFMKQLPDDPVQGPLSLPYVAGLFDAEGSISITGNSSTVLISQKDPAIRVALEQQFGGHSSNWSWRPPEAGRPFLQAIKPFCIEKLEQIELVLSMDGNGPQIKALLDPLQRNKRKLASILSTAVTPAER